MRVLIVHEEVQPGARADEADVLVQAGVIASALHELGHEAQTLGMTLDLQAASERIRLASPDLVFNIVESLGGHGRLIHVIPALLDAMHVPYTGVSAEGQFATSNKLFAKQVMKANGLSTAIWHTMASLRECDRFDSCRYIIKSVWEHASVGLDEDSVIEATAPWQLREAIETRLDRLGGEGFAEAFIDGREFNLALLADGAVGVEVLPPAEIVFAKYAADKPRVVGYRAKWNEDSYEYNNTPRKYEFGDEDQALIARLSALAIKCWQTFQLSGYARVDFRVDQHGDPYILEINTNPCLSPDAGFAAALNQASIPFTDAVARIIDAAVARASSAVGHVR